MRLFLKRPCIAGGCSWTKMIVYVQISWRELIFVIYLAYLEANLNDSFFGDLGIDFVNPSVNTVLVKIFLIFCFIISYLWLVKI